MATWECIPKPASLDIDLLSKVQELSKHDSMASTPRMTLNLESLLLLFLFSKVVTEIPICAVMIEGMFLNYLANTSSDGLIVESSVLGPWREWEEHYQTGSELLIYRTSLLPALCGIIIMN